MRNKRRNIEFETKAGQGDSLPGFSCLLALCFERVPDNLTGPPDAFLIGVGVHSERHRRVAMAQTLADRYHVRAVGDRKGGTCVAALVGVKILYAVPLAKLLKIAGGGLCGCIMSGLLSWVNTYRLIAFPACSRRSCCKRFSTSGPTSTVRDLPF